MNTRIKSAPSVPSANRAFGRKPLLVALGGGVVLAGVLGASIWSRSGSSDRPAPVPPAAVSGASHGEGYAVLSSDGRTNPHHVYLAGSEAQAAIVSAGINEGESVRAGLGLGPFLGSIIVVTSDAQAAEVMAAITEGNRILDTLGVLADTVVDLR